MSENGTETIQAKPRNDPQTRGVEDARSPAEASALFTSRETPNSGTEDEVAQWNRQVRQRMGRQTRRSFLIGGAAALGAVGGWRWLASRRQVGEIPWPLRQGLELDQQWAQDVFPAKKLTRELGGNRQLSNRVNGDVGLDDAVDVSAWRLRLGGLANDSGSATLTLDQIKSLPRVEMTAEFNCIEGWTVVIEWAGARFTDFMRVWPPDTASGDPLDLERRRADLPPYVGMETPDGGYYVGLDIQSMLHPQTLLAYEMNGRPLTQEHGAPLRLVTPVKYGVKSIKRIGMIQYAFSPPPDYWAERGYDWYLGL